MRRNADFARGSHVPSAVLDAMQDEAVGMIPATGNPSGARALRGADGRYERVQPRHSWNTNKRMSSVVLYSLTRHSAHHEKGDLPFWKLKPYPDAPTMPYGYLTTILIAMIPPVWFRVIAPSLAHWDNHFASKEELALLRSMHAEAA